MKVRNTNRVRPFSRSVRPSIHPSTHPSACPRIRPSVHPTVPPFSRSVRPSPSIRPFLRFPALFVRPSVHPTSARPCMHGSVPPSIRPSVRFPAPSVCPSIRPSAHPSARQRIFPSVHPTVPPFSRSGCPSVRPTSFPQRAKLSGSFAVSFPESDQRRVLVVWYNGTGSKLRLWFCCRTAKFHDCGIVFSVTTVVEKSVQLKVLYVKKDFLQKFEEISRNSKKCKNLPIQKQVC